MGKIAFVFSGQGDQHEGMGKDIYDAFPSARKIFDKCEEVEKGTLEKCFYSESAVLRKTKNTQICLYALENAYLEILKEKGIVPDFIAGFSLGEISALRAAEVFSLEDGMKLVSKRGLFMQKAAEKEQTFMAAVLKLGSSELEEICSKFKNIYPVNYNCPGQISVSGSLEEKGKFFEEVKIMGGRCIPLNVTGAFHSPFMDEAASQFYEELSGYTLSSPSVPVFSDLTGEPYEGDFKKLLSRQINNPVRWEKIIRNIISMGADTFIEIGPGKTLSNMIRKTDKNVKTYSTSDLNEILEKVIPC